MKSSSNVDNRTYKFFPFFMKDFIGPLVEKRIQLKKEKDNPLAQA